LNISGDKDAVFHEKKILVVDDDMRNVFAISAVLEDKGLTIIAAKNGKEGIDKLFKNTDIDLVLMDIMMPEMDGYEAMQLIRKDKRFTRLPIIALTAKAMKDDRQKCIDAGANDYLTKPFDAGKLISMLRVWLYR
jgi:CheY-like chemotaxis protein